MARFFIDRRPAGPTPGRAMANGYGILNATDRHTAYIRKRLAHARPNFDRSQLGGCQ